MATEIDKFDGKILSVVFEKKKAWGSEKDAQLEKKVMLERQLYKKIAVDLAKERIKKKIAVICAEYDKAKEQKKKKIANIAKAVKEANQQENRVTEKFLGDVESMVTRFKAELDKMQEIFGNIIRKLPQVQFEQIAIKS